jgi:hypothetical protein
MKCLAALVLLIAGLAAAGSASSALANDYTYENRPVIMFGPKRGDAHISPFPMSKRSAAVWAESACWRDCTARCTWRFEACVSNLHSDECRPYLADCDLACQKQCRTRGGPLLNITE